MNGVHDMGGMHGLGPVAPEADEPVFHERWEARALALTLAAGAWGRWNIDTSRQTRERIPGPDYLRMSYYEKWLAALEIRVVKYGFVTKQEMQSGNAAPGSTKATPVLTPTTATTLNRAIPSSKDPSIRPLFQVGQQVRARNINPEGHTRLPRYARGKTGHVVLDHGVYTFPDTNARYQGEKRQHLYSVRFTARELWGEAASPRDSVHLDMWDDYLEHA